MKKYILFITIFIGFVTAQAQVLYTENFDNLTLGNVGTDVTGVTPGQGGWYTESMNITPYNVPTTPAAYQIVAEPNKGKVVQISSMHLPGEARRLFFRTDLYSYWQQRTVGNNVLKISFDFYTGDDVDNGVQGGDIHIQVRSKEGNLVGYIYKPFYSYIAYKVYEKRGDFIDVIGGGDAFRLNNQVLTIPKKTWITLQCYVDYDNSEVYFSIPSLNYTIVEKVNYTLQLGGVDIEGAPKPDDSPVALRFLLEKYAHGNIIVNSYSPKIDNINMSAQNTVPTVTVSVDEVLSNSFNLYPNPATTMVTITSVENTQVSKVNVYSVSGKLLSTQNYANETNIQLNTESWSSGIYMLHIETTEGTAVKKLIKK